MTDQQLIEMIQRIEKAGSGYAVNYNRFELTKPMRELLELRSPGTVVPEPRKPSVWSPRMRSLFIFCCGFLIFLLAVRAPNVVVFTMFYTTVIAAVGWIIID